MKKYLVCYWAERNDEATDLEEIVEATNIMEAVRNFTKGKRILKRITSVSEITNTNYTPNFYYETRT
jgi:hypothetical protein